MKNKLLAIMLFLMAAFHAAPLFACGGMSHDHDGGAATSSSATPAEAAKQSGGGAAMEKLISPYLAIRASLAEDNISDVATQAEVFAAALRAAAPAQGMKAAEKQDKNKSHKLAKKGLKIMKKIPCAGHAAMMIEDQFFSYDGAAGTGTFEKLQQAAQSLTNNKSELRETRNNFAAMSDAFVNYIKESGAQAGGLQLYFCRMANRYWLQKSGEPIGNPFFGSKMPDCGEQASLASASLKADEADAKPSSGHKHN